MTSGNKARQPDPHSRPLEHELDVPSGAVLRGAASLRQLRDHVQALVKELDHLRDRNRKLAHRITQLESEYHRSSKLTNLSFDEDKEQLLEQVHGFIKTIDSYLINEQDQTE